MSEYNNNNNNDNNKDNKDNYDEDDDILKRLGVMFLVFLVIFSLLEMSTLLAAFIFADKIDCNFLWCTFTTERNRNTDTQIITSSSSYSSISTQECYENGKLINCSDMNHHISVPGFIP